MPQLSAVLLHVGEDTVELARRSLELQTLTLAETVEVVGVVPFGRAFNEAVQRVQTEYFLQCDADMQLYPHCAEHLLEPFLQDPQVAVSVGHLADPLQGKIRGVKIFRTRACREFSVPADQPDAESRHIQILEQNGWKMVTLPEVLGTHREQPGEERYHFERFRLLGLKIRIKSSWWDLTYRLVQLRACLPRPEAISGAIGLWLGLSVVDAGIQNDLPASEEFLRWRERPTAGPSDPPTVSQGTPLQEAFLEGWARARERTPVDLDSLVGNCLASGQPELWTWIVGFLAGWFDVRGRRQECWLRVEGWTAALQRHLPSLLQQAQV